MAQPGATLMIRHFVPLHEPRQDTICQDPSRPRQAVPLTASLRPSTHMVWVKLRQVSPEGLV
jgi:hypothetical protein